MLCQGHRCGTRQPGWGPGSPLTSAKALTLLVCEIETAPLSWTIKVKLAHRMCARLFRKRLPLVGKFEFSKNSFVGMCRAWLAHVC